MNIKIINISKIYTWNSTLNKLDVLTNKEILIKDGIIADISENIDVYDEVIDAKYKIVTPGFIDSHTHPVFIGERSEEFVMRLNGLSYNQIAKEGGGILSSVRSVRSSSYDDLYDAVYKNILPFIYNGTTTLEAKSGYGLTLSDEIKSLEVLRSINKELEIEIIPTFLGAHTFPEEYINNKEKYIDIICNDMIPEISEKKLAVFCDVFCEEGYFDYKQSKKILNTAKKNNLIPRLHADEFTYSRASELAKEVGAISADHLMSINKDGIESLSNSDVIATLLPGTTFFLNKQRYADGRTLIDKGCRVALASDFNPGTCTIRSLSFIIFLAMNNCNMTLEEAFLGVTYHAALGLGIEKRVGLIKEGFDADLIIWNLNSLEDIPYWIDESSKSNKINSIFKRGKVIVQ